MDIRNKFFWFVAASTAITLLIAAVFAAWFWAQLTPAEAETLLRIFKQHFIYVFGGFLLFLAIGVFIMDGLFHTYIIPISRLTEETLLIGTVNPSHRIGLQGGKDIQRLARIINEGADRFESLKKKVDEKILQATAAAETEKNMLAAIMAELPEGVLICNAAGQILLYNNRAKRFFSEGDMVLDSGEAPGRFIGLGRSVFGIIDRNCIVHALDEISEKLRRNEADIVAYFIIADERKNLLRVETVPILNPHRQFTGFILIFFDITAQLESDGRAGKLLGELTRGIRHASAGIRSAAEAILAYPDMARDHLDRFIRIIHKESVSISRVMSREGDLLAESTQTQWPLVQMPVENLLASLVKRAGEKLGVVVDLDPVPENGMVEVCSYSLTFALLFVINRLKETAGCRRFRCSAQKTARCMTVAFQWEGSPVKIEVLRNWSAEPLRLADERMPLTLSDVMGYHHAEIGSYPDPTDPRVASLGLFLPVVKARDLGHARKATIVPESRPEYYDFDLFSQPGQVPELDNRPLTDLTYTVFDTETTGLNPTGGDEIISIGAVRIVNGRLLRDDTFDQIIDPKRDLPPESIRFHGILPEMIQGQPTIDQVLPLFQRFAEDTILVAHNAAFDMRMLQVKEAATGVVFINPVLDTMLLSEVVHSAQGDHNLEAIADRLGVQVMGRHTALGDALVTGDIFLKLIPLLENHGIRTLRQARDASRKTHYARLKY